MTGDTDDARATEQTAALSPLSSDPYVLHHDMRIVGVERGAAQVQVTVPAWARNAVGVCHGGMILTLADYAAGVANHTIAPDLSVQGHINWLASAAPGDVLTAEARVLHAGRRTFVTHVEVRNQSGRRVAWATFTGARVSDVAHIG